MTEFLIVAQQQRRAIDLRENHVEITIAINVGECRTATHDKFEKIGTGFFWRYSDERRAFRGTRIPEKLRRLAISLVLPHLLDLLLEMTIGGEHIEPAIEVVVEE